MVFGAGSGTNGQWVRTSNPDNVKAFQAEQEMRAAEDRERLQRSAEFRSRMWGKLRSLFRRSS